MAKSATSCIKTDSLMSFQGFPFIFVALLLCDICIYSFKLPIFIWLIIVPYKESIVAIIFRSYKLLFESP